MSTTLEVPSETLSASSAHEAPLARLLTSADALDELRRLWGRADWISSPIERWSWAETCLATVARHRPLRMAVITQGDELLALAPLVQTRRLGTARWVATGAAELHEPMDLAFANSSAIERLARLLAKTRSPLFLERVPAESPTVGAIQRAFRGRAIVIVRPRASSPYIRLDSSWLEPEQNLNSGRRSDLRRARKRAEQIGPLRTEILTPTADEVDALFDLAFEIEGRSWKAETGTALSCDSFRAEFYRAYARAACRDGILRFCFLHIGQRVAAMQMAIECGGAFWLLKVGYDAQLANCSPGQLLMRDTIRYSVQNGLDRYEFLGKAETWTQVWTKLERVRGTASLPVWHPRRSGARDRCLRRAMVREKLEMTRLKSAAVKCVLPLMRRAARAYIAGDRLEDALNVADKLAARQLRSTLAYWDHHGEDPAQVASIYAATARSLTGRAEDYLSIKLPSLGYSPDHLAPVAEAARQAGVRLHFDALGIETADQTRAAIDALLFDNGGAKIGFTLPGRWTRSVEDARWAAERQLFVRIVKGQWADPTDPTRDLRQGYLEVVEALAGRASHVAVASHDPPLAEMAIRRLQKAGTPCEMELLYGLPMHPSLDLAKRLGVTVRVYVPFGQSYLPYALSQIRRSPRMMAWLAKDFFVGRWRARATSVQMPL